MPWTDPTFQFILFGIAFLFLYALAGSVLLTIRENYRRHYQKADLQWTGKGSRFRGGRLRLVWLVPAAALTSWIVVRFLIN